MPKKIQNGTVKETTPQQHTQINQGPVQPAPQMTNVTYDSEGRPIFANNPYMAQPVKAKKVGVFVAAIITLVLAIGLTVFATVYNMKFFSDAGNDAGSLIAFILYIITGLGIVIIIPGLGCAIAAVSCSAVACKSCNKTIKGFSIFFLIISIITLIASVITPFILLMAMGNAS